MKKLISVAASVIVLSVLSSTAFANDDDSRREVVRDLKTSIQSLEGNLMAQGVDLTL